MEKIRKKLSEEHKKHIRESMKGKMPKFIPLGYWKGKLFTSEHRKKLSLSHLGKLVGENSLNWKGGQNLSYWKRAVKRRDKKCMKCYITDVRVLTADHIKSKAIYPNLIYEISNGITLCYNCHAIKTLEDKEYRKYMSDNHWKNNGNYQKNNFK